MKKLHEAVDWHRNVPEHWQQELAISKKKLQTEPRVVGIGFDQWPLIYACAALQKRDDPATPVIYSCVFEEAIRSANCPATVQLDFIVDCHGFQPLLNLSVRPWLKMAKSLDSYFAERVHRIFVIDMPPTAAVICKAIMPLFPPKTRSKLIFLSREKYNEIDELFDELCEGDDMRSTIAELICRNRLARPGEDRAPSIALTDALLSRQRRHK